MNKLVYEPPQLTRVSPKRVAITAAFAGAGNLLAERSHSIDRSVHRHVSQVRRQGADH